MDEYMNEHKINDIEPCTSGSRVNKHWFQVQDSHSRTQKLLTMTQLSQQCVLPCTNHTKRTLSELFELLSTVSQYLVVSQCQHQSIFINVYESSHEQGILKCVFKCSTSNDQ